jgi:hypothetical protein
MPKLNRRDSSRHSLSSNIDFLDTTPSPTKSIKEQEPVKVLVVTGRCSKVFKSTLEDCVEDCILEFPGEKNSVYVPKFGQPIQIPIGSNRNSIASLREQSTAAHQSARSNRRRSSITQHNTLPQIGGGVRSSSTNNFSLATTALAATSVTRMRHQLMQQRFSVGENISEESIDQQTIFEEPPNTTNNGSEAQSKRPSLHPDESIAPNLNMTSLSLPAFPTAKNSLTYRDRQKNYRLSDLVMFGPEYFAHVFNLPRNQSSSRRRHSKKTETLTELERIKQDLFHRYLWTQKPQVSCRIRPMSSYYRSSTFAI